jgi:hypothetical protein
MLSSRAYMTYTVRYAAQLDLSLWLGDVPIALSPSLQFLLQRYRKPGITPPIIICAAVLACALHLCV